MSRGRHKEAKQIEAQRRGDKYRRLSLVYSAGAVSASVELEPAPVQAKPSRAEFLAARMARRKARKGARKALRKERQKSRRQRGREYTARYLEYIQSPAWFEFRAAIFSERGRRCEQCLRTDGIMHLHHLTYRRLGQEKPGDVKILCVDCHEKVHGRLTTASSSPLPSST